MTTKMTTTTKKMMMLMMLVAGQRQSEMHRIVEFLTVVPSRMIVSFSVSSHRCRCRPRRRCRQYPPLPLLHPHRRNIFPTLYTREIQRPQAYCVKDFQRDANIYLALIGYVPKEKRLRSVQYSLDPLQTVLALVWIGLARATHYYCGVVLPYHHH